MRTSHAFLTEQLAGDEIENPTGESIIATGYYRLGQWDDEPADPVQALYDDLDDILATTSQGMLGLTINCARCHDHKIDPIPARDYYSMLAFFRNVRRYGVRGHDTVLDASSRNVDSETPPSDEAVAEHGNQIAERQSVISEIEGLVKDDFEPVELEDYEYVENRIRLVEKRVKSELITQDQFNRYRDACHQLKNLHENPPHLNRVLCVKEHHNEPPLTHVLIRGNPALKGDPVEPGFVSVLSPPEPEIAVPENGETSGRRRALAEWITSPDHPLTARVMVNRIWQHHFGRGIVRSSNDFGFQGDPPTHPTQALGLVNSEFTNTESAHFARIISEQFDKPEDQVREVLRRATQREPSDEEISNGVRLIESWQNEDDVSAEQALAFYCLYAINLNEFIFLD